MIGRNIPNHSLEKKNNLLSPAFADTLIFQAFNGCLLKLQVPKNCENHIIVNSIHFLSFSFQGSGGGPSFFSRGLPTYLTSTPAVPGEASNRPSSHTPGILSMTHATESSSGISSVATRSSNPTPIPPSFVPNYGPTPSVHFADEVMTHEANDGSRLASLVAQSLSISQSRGRNTGTASQSLGTTPVVRYMSFGNDSQNSKCEYHCAL